MSDGGNNRDKKDCGEALFKRNAALEAELRESERRYRSLTESLPHLVWTCRGDGPCDYLSPRWVEYTGIPENDQLGYAWLKQLHPDDRERVVAEWNEGAPQGNVFDIEFRIRRADGVHRWFKTRAIPFCDDYGKVVKWFGSNTDIDDYKQSIEALRESEERHRATLYSIGDAVISTDTKGRITQMNPVAETFTGWTEAEAKGKPSAEVFHIVNEETRAKVESPVDRVLHEGTVVGLANHTLLIAKGGSEHPIADSGAPIHNENGRIIGVVLVFRDQSAERASKRALEESERKFRETVRNLDEAYYSCALDGLLREHNTAFNHLLGFDGDRDLRGSMLPDFWQHAEDRKEYLRELMSKGVIRNYLIKAMTIGGDKLVVMANSHIVKDESGVPVGIEGTFTDFSERMRAEEALREAHDNLEQRVVERTRELAAAKQLLDETGRLANVGGWEIDVHRNELNWTDVVREIHEVEPGYRPTVEAGINFYAPEAVPVISEAVRLAVEEGRPFDVELQLITAKNNRIWVRAVGEAIRENGGIAKVHGVFQDINQRKLADIELEKHREYLRSRTAQLEEANKELEAFSYSVSHDLRAPLRAIDGFTRILMDDYASHLDTEGKRLCSIIHDNTEKMSRLIDDLLAFSRLGRTEMCLSRIDMGTMASSIFNELTTPEMRARTDFRVGAVPQAFADPTLMRQVWTNLISNAVKFSSKRDWAVIEVSARPGEGENIYIVQDNGAGFDMRYVDKLFGVFQRLHSSKEFEGTGVGLALVQRVIHRHGGRVWGEGEPDKGATFFFALTDKGE
jgi:PAS domain S-box-containing protein